jgi:ABC-2 type transport system ATP-binding protein
MSMLLKIENIQKIYFNKKSVKEALKNISFELFKGEIFSLLGVNGAGKTTLSSIIASLHPPTKGDIFWNNQSIYKNLLEYRKIVGFCPQAQNLDPSLTLQQNLVYQGKYYGVSKRELLQRVEDLLNKFDLKEYRDSKVEILSGGYKQRFLIARTLIHNPSLVILDEPTVGLDPQVRHHLWDYILSLKNEGITILLTTHYLDEAEKLSDRVCVIDQGKIKIIDTPMKLISDMKKKNLEDVFLHLLKEGELYEG